MKLLHTKYVGRERASLRQAALAKRRGQHAKSRNHAVHWDRDINAEFDTILANAVDVFEETL